MRNTQSTSLTNHIDIHNNTASVQRSHQRQRKHSASSQVSLPRLPSIAVVAQASAVTDTGLASPTNFTRCRQP